MSYEPTFAVSPEMHHMAFRIIEKLVRIERYGTLESNPRLKKQNLIRAIHSSCSIEGNSLTLGQVTDLINGHRVLGPERDIREVQNAYAAYSLLESFDPCDLNEMLRIHGTLTEGLIEESGQFRSGEEGVFSGNTCIYVAPPPEKVPGMMADLFGWLNGSHDTVGLLIASCVFHYGLVFIHPFADGNGRIARLWQKALLAKWRPVFRWIPIETRIWMAQQEYYDVIGKCDGGGNSDAFIGFMLRIILSALEDVEYTLRTAEESVPGSVSKLTAVMKEEVWYTSRELMELLKMSSRPMFQTNYLAPAISRDFIEMEYPDSPRSRYQKYRLKRY